MTTPNKKYQDVDKIINSVHIKEEYSCELSNVNLRDIIYIIKLL